MLQEHRLNNLYARYGVVFILLFFALSWQPVAAKDSADAKQLIERAKSGDADAQYELGLSYRDGEGVKQSDRKAAKWLLKAHKKGKNYDAAVDLGDLYMLGRGFNISFNRNQAGGERAYVEKAMKLYTKAAEKGNARAQFRLGTLYVPSQSIDGSFLYTNWQQSQKSYMYKSWKRAKKVYEVTNLHLSKKFPRAEKLLLAAAENGHAEAQYTLGRLYTEHDFSAAKKEKGIELYRAAAMQGHFLATYDLAVIYAQGKLGTVNLSESYAWFSIADKLAEQRSESKTESNMHAGVRKSLTAVLDAMEPVDLSRAERLVQERMPVIEQSVIVL